MPGPGATPTSACLRAVLFEDYFLQFLHGRTANFNPADDSYVGHYTPEERVRQRWVDLRRRDDVVHMLPEGNDLFVVKNPEMQPLCGVITETFPGAVIIHVLRHGNDVVQYTVQRGWYTDAY